MNVVKKTLVVAVVFAFFLALSSCNRHTCPTYSQTNTTATTSNA